MNYFWEKNKYFIAIIVGAVIIGAFVYLGLQSRVRTGLTQTVIPAKAGIQIAASPLAPRNDGTVKINSVVKNQKAESGTPLNYCGAPSNTIITKVIDGDTVVVEGGWHVRLLGMDADEKGYPCYDPAKTRLENLVLSKQIVLEKDVSDVDQYGRCLRYIFLGNENIDTQLVKEGLAVARFYQPDVKYRTEISNAETYAQQNKIGCKWSGASQVK